MNPRGGESIDGLLAYGAQNDVEAMERIACLLRTHVEGALSTTLREIAEVVRDTGRPVEPF